MSQYHYRGELRSDEPMAKHTSWRCGGAARQYYIPADVDDLSAFLQQLPDDEAVYFMGLGSNTMVRDAGFDGTVIAMQNVNELMKVIADDVVEIGAGVTCAKFARFCASEHLSGAEFFAGIPGLVGGALAMNAGAFGGETWNHVLSVVTIDRSGVLHTREAGEYEVTYRHVSGIEGEWFISARMRFERDETGDQVADIKRMLARRSDQQPTGVHSCGSVFKNPEGDHAGRLIEDCGLKGERIGGAVVSIKHANFILNDKTATASDIEALIELVQARVYEKHSVRLEPEVKIIGEVMP